MSRTFRLLSIDAWNGPEGWFWNAWYNVGDVPEECTQSTRKLLKHLRATGFLSQFSSGKVAVEDDQLNLVIVDKNTRRPIFAVEYGTEV